MCGLSNGAALGARLLYSDGEEHILSARRPCIMNGIDTLTNRGDLLDRTTVVELEKITEDDRKQEADILAKFEECRPGLLGLLLDATVTGLKRLPDVIAKKPKLPRMADYCIWVMACEPALPWKEGSFLDVYNSSRSSACVTLVESDQVAKAVYDLAILYEDKPWEGTATELLNRLEYNKGIVYDRIPKGWPRTAGVLSSRLNRVAPAL
jgi:hypothetical protein